MTEEPKPEIVAAADWWASRLGRGRPASGDVEIDLLLAGERRRQSRRPPEEVDAFRVALISTLEKHVARHWGPIADRSYRASALRAVKVDYDPPPVLVEAAKAAGLDLGMAELPIKTVMWIDPGHVTVKDGYGSPRTLVWSAPDWERPLCGKHRQEGDHRHYTVFNEVCGKPIYHEDGCGDWIPDTRRCAFCGGTYVDHESMEAYARPDACPDWWREAES